MRHRCCRSNGQVSRYEIAQLLREFHDRFMSEASKHDMFQLIKLVADGGVDARVGVTKQIDPPGTDSIEVAFPPIVIKPHALRPER